jgi:hypothetical protein
MEGRTNNEENSDYMFREIEVRNAFPPILVFLFLFCSHVEFAGSWQLEWLLEEHSEGMVVRTGISCRHGQFPRLACCWSGVDAGRRFLQCSNVENPCDFKYWIDPEFCGRANRVIQDLASMNGSLSELVKHFHGQWDELLGSRQEAREECHKLKAICSEQLSCICILLCFVVLMACCLSLVL